MTRGRWVALVVGGTCAAAVGLPAGLVLGLVGTMTVAPKDFPAYHPARAAGLSPTLSPGRSGAAQARREETVPEPTLGDARARILAAHSRFLRRERYTSSLLERYRPTVTRKGRRATPALLGALERTARLHANARAELEADPVPQPLAAAHAATIRMLAHAEAAHRSVIDAGRRRDADFALVREAPFARALGEHYAALDALRAVPGRSVEASLSPAGS